jgi:hypothetical protein
MQNPANTKLPFRAERPVFSGVHFVNAGRAVETASSPRAFCAEKSLFGFRLLTFNFQL